MLNENINKLSDLKKFSEKEVAGFHGMGSSGIKLLKATMKIKNLNFKI
jgi:hypothetical protein